MSDIKVQLADGYLTLVETSSGYAWQPSSSEVHDQASLANAIASAYTYLPADGEPGYALASEVAWRLKGKAILPPVKPGPEGVVY